MIGGPSGFDQQPSSRLARIELRRPALRFNVLDHADQAARYFETALQLNGRMGARPWLAHTQSDYADMLLARDAPGDREQAERLLSEALATYQDLGMQRAAARASAQTVERADGF